jgi:hypothetical protein
MSTLEVVAATADQDRWLVLTAEGLRIVELGTANVSGPMEEDLALTLAQWEPQSTAPEAVIELATKGIIADPAEVESTGPETFKVMILDESLPTDDGRSFNENSVDWREPPIPLMFTIVNGEGHKGSVLGGSITELWREGTQIWGKGNYANTPEGQQLSALVGDRMLTGVSADIANAHSEKSVNDLDELVENIDRGTVIGATVLPFPAFGSTRIENEAADTTEAVADPEAIAASAVQRIVLVASADCEDCRPPEAWFTNPNLTGPTAPTLTADGHYFGHLALKGTCHLGIRGECFEPPTSKADYAYFRTGAVETREGTIVATGPITLGTGHASTTMRLSPTAAAAHYDNTGFAAADVVAGEDEYGIWFSGAIRPGVGPERVRELRAAALSGDWREIGTNLEMVAVLAVNTPGYPVPRARAEMAVDRRLALVAAGVITDGIDPAAAEGAPIPLADDVIDARLTQIENAVTALASQIFSDGDAELGLEGLDVFAAFPGAAPPFKKKAEPKK